MCSFKVLQTLSMLNKGSATFARTSSGISASLKLKACMFCLPHTRQVATLAADEVLAQVKHIKQPQDTTNPPTDGCTGRKHRPQQLARLQSLSVAIYLAEPLNILKCPDVRHSFRNFKSAFNPFWLSSRPFQPVHATMHNDFQKAR